MLDACHLVAGHALQLFGQLFLRIGAIIVFTGMGFWQAMDATEAGATSTGQIQKAKLLAATGAAL